MLRAPIRLGKLLWHIGRGLALTAARHRRPPEVQAEIVRAWLAAVPGVLGVRVSVHGEVPDGAGLWVANHISWLDIPLLGGLGTHAVFLSKEEISRWPLIGALATGAGTLYMRRGAGTDAAREAMREGLAANKRIIIFPEGTTTLGAEVRRFHPRLFQPALDQGTPVIPIALRYRCAEANEPARAAAYIDDDHFLGSLWRIARAKQLVAEVVFCPAQPTQTLDADSRRDAIAQSAERAVRRALDLHESG